MRNSKLSTSSPKTILNLRVTFSKYYPNVFNLTKMIFFVWGEWIFCVRYSMHFNSHHLLIDLISWHFLISLFSDPGFFVFFVFRLKQHLSHYPIYRPELKVRYRKMLFVKINLKNNTTLHGKKGWTYSANYSFSIIN